MLMESSTGAVSWQPHNLAKAPGEMLRNSLTYAARGADAVCFFQWRASAQGPEKFHSAMLPHAGTDTATWREVLRLSAALDRLDEVAGSTVEAEVGLLFSWQSWWATEGESRPSQSITYLDQVHRAYQALRELGVTTDVVAPAARLDRYRLVVVPCLHLITDEEAAAIEAYVAAGGHVLVTFFSGTVDHDDRIRLDGYPGAFRDLLGVTVEEFVPLPPEVEVSLDTGARARLWTERLRVTTAYPVARYVDGPVTGVPAVTRNSFGAGTAWYLATELRADALRDVVREAIRTAGVRPLGPEGDGSVEVVRRRADRRSYLFVINHGTDEIQYAATGTDLVTGDVVRGLVRVPAGDVRVIREESV
jgi:beta-galactosidase